MDSLKIIQSAYSIVLYKILNKIRHDDDGDCDMDLCGTNTYDYFDNYVITYLPYDDDYPRKGAFYITFYQKYDMELINEAMREVHQYWKKDVENVLERCNNNWVVDLYDNELTLKNTIDLCDSNNFLMKPLNDYTFMTLFNVANYFDMCRVSPIVPIHLIENFIVYEESFYDYLQQISFQKKAERQYETIRKYGHQKEYVFDDSFTTTIPNNREDFPTFQSTPYMKDDMEDVMMVKAYAHMADKIIKKDFVDVINGDYVIRFLKIGEKQYFAILEFSKSFTYNMVSKSIRYVNSIEEYDFTDIYNEMKFMRPIHNKLLISVIDYYDDDEEEIQTDILKEIYDGEYILNKKKYNIKVEYDHFYSQRYGYNNFSRIFDAPNFR